MKQKAFLKRGERINILDVAYPSRHRVLNPSDLLLLKIDKRQHSWGDRLAAGRDQVRWNDKSIARFARKAACETRQRRHFENAVHLCDQSCTTKSLQHLNDQQRVST